MLEETKEVTLGGRKFVLAPMNLKELQLFEDINESASKGIKPSREVIRQTCEVFWLAAKRGEGTDFPFDTVMEHVTLRNYGVALRALMEVSGLVQPQGEAIPVTADASNGASSTEPSSPSLATVSSR